MLTLVTSNPKKYEPFAQDLARLRITLEPPKAPLPEIQSLHFSETLAAKARAAAQMFGRPVLVDDAGLILKAYAPFPGPLTSTVLRSLEVAGLQRLVAGASADASMECHLGIWLDGALRSWEGAVAGWLDFSRSPTDERMLLSDLFVPEKSNQVDVVASPLDPRLAGASNPTLMHRARALASLEASIFRLHLDLSPASFAEPSVCARPLYECPFCAEFDQDGLSIFARMMGDRIHTRVVYEDEHFVVMPPLGQFIEGGLLLLTRKHVLSVAHLPPGLFEHLERLLLAIGKILTAHWGVPPLVFEHGPAPQWGKGVCCVDHAHLNIFPARAQIHPELAARMHMPLSSLSELTELQRAEFGYLFVHENDGTRRVYDGQGAPTQLVRRIITMQLGIPERWHWRDYLGTDELLATYRALKGQIQL